MLPFLRFLRCQEIRLIGSCLLKRKLAGASLEHHFQVRNSYLGMEHGDGERSRASKHRRPSTPWLLSTFAGFLASALLPVGFTKPRRAADGISSCN